MLHTLLRNSGRRMPDFANSKPEKLRVGIVEKLCTINNTIPRRVINSNS